MNFSPGILRVWVFFCSCSMKVKANVPFCFAKVKEPCWIEYTPFKYFGPVLGKGSKIRLIIFAEFSVKGYPNPPFVENDYFFFWHFFQKKKKMLKMIYSLWNEFCMIWENHLSIFWHLHLGENMWSWPASR